jgi:hypothetical protein
MAKVKVLVLYPTGFTGLGLDPAGSDVVELDEAVAETVVGHGWAEYVKAPKARKTETGAVKLEADS